MKILRATHLGMCFGVRDAIALAHREADKEPLTILGDLVHNETVLASLRERGVSLEPELEAVNTPTVMITAHGASETAKNRVRQRGFKIVEATCPLVHFAHRALHQLVNAGFHPVIVGKRDHVEVRGMTEDLLSFDVVLSEEDVERLEEHSRIGVVSQTTQPIDRVRYFVELIKRRFPNSEIRFTDTVCQPTKQRQTAAVTVAEQSDVVIVIGGASSNNTRELVKTCAEYCGQVHHIQNVTELCAEWFAGANVVGLTAGTSTPDSTIDAVEKWLMMLAGGAGSEPPAAQDSHSIPIELAEAAK